MSVPSKTHSLTHAAATIAALAASFITLPASAQATSPKPTIVLVHGAMADASSWSGVIPLLIDDGYHVVAVAEPLRSLSGDAEYLCNVVQSIGGPVVLVGHSYGGSVVTDMVERGIDIKALVYVAAFAPAKGEAALDLVGKMPGSQLGAALAAPILLADGSHDLAVDPEKFIEPFALDLPEAQARLMAVTQRPINERALKEPSSNESWSSHPSFFIYGSEDKSIPPALQEYMAKRAHSRETIVVPGASHLVMLSHPEAVAGVIEDAAQAK